MGIGHEIRRKVAAIELHTFDPFDLGAQRLAFVDRDDAVFADFFHCVCEQATDFAVVIRGDGTHVRHVGLIFDLDRHALQLGGDIGDGRFDALLHENRVDAGDHSLQAFVENRFSHHRGSRRTVTSDIARLAGNFPDHAGANVFVGVFEVNFLGHGDTVLGDGG